MLHIRVRALSSGGGTVQDVHCLQTSHLTARWFHSTASAQRVTAT